MKAIYSLLALCAVIALLIVVGSKYQEKMESVDRENIPGELVPTSAGNIHLVCKGEGRPTVILENGLGTPFTSWAKVQDLVKEHTQICAYDRSGLGWSDHSSLPADSNTVARTLNEVLINAGISDEIVLVGWSSGGLHVREFYSMFPEKVEAMVFVDSSHEQQVFRLPRGKSHYTADPVLALCDMISWTGALRALGATKLFATAPPGTESHEQELATLNRALQCNTQMNELKGFFAGQSPDRPLATLGDVPIIVISRGIYKSQDQYPKTFDDDHAEKYKTAWQQLQDEIASLSTQSEIYIAKNSGHEIPYEQPDIISASIMKVISGP